MQNKLSIRSYNRDRRSHSHDFYQLVLPIKGVINIDVGVFSGKVAPGECVLINKNEMHHFTANREARFVVVETDMLPINLTEYGELVIAINPPLTSYLNFVEQQLEYQVNPVVERAMFHTLVLLLAEQQPLPRLDKRIGAVLLYIEQRLSDTITISGLAKIACLSDTQFKKVFREQVGQTAMQYVTQKRMEKAKALLQHTDYSIQMIAEHVGYIDISAFSRRFSNYFGLTPTQFSH
jgi:AraC-like DNA-binding protein